MAFELPLFYIPIAPWLAQQLRHTEYAYYFNTSFAQMDLWVCVQVILLFFRSHVYLFSGHLILPELDLPVKATAGQDAPPTDSSNFKIGQKTKN